MQLVHFKKQHRFKREILKYDSNFMEKVRDKCKIKKTFKMQGKVYMEQKYLQIYHQTLIFKGKYSSPAT